MKNPAFAQEAGFFYFRKKRRRRDDAQFTRGFWWRDRMLCEKVKGQGSAQRV
ncbi:hypothetical protein ACIPLR_11730 [Herbaspirillum huttiense]|uniref:hypothetical protein n=1 Tax=Herbaspirillum TaxID=963 RepID=UPI0003F5E866|nr:MULTISPECIES: hypothetical protein [Herbaspirillum]|tara:strand:- start:465 stop:620 length:156 start_codon:yes stop_codon:yes gene_type:complete